MDAVFGLLLLLLGASHGWETFCDGRQKRAECFGALGGTLNLRLMENASEIFIFNWYKITQSKTILIWVYEKLIQNKLEDRSSFTPDNGTLKINNLNHNDGGEYELKIYKDESRALSEIRTLQLTIQVPVSSVQMVSECLSQGEMRVLCSSEGDSPQYSWTLDGQPLTSQLLSDHGQNITLKQKVGRLVCTVQNQVSRVSKGENMSACGYKWIECTLLNGTYISQLLPFNETQCIQTTAGANHLFILCVRAAVFILIIVSIFVYYTWKKKKIEKAEVPAGQQQDYENVSVIMVQMRGFASEL